jgi:uncharacterized membrane protein YgcG
VPARAGDDAVSYQGQRYRKLYSYTGKITYVLGEFYWRLQRDERTFNTDYQGPTGRRLNREETAGEVVWSAGESMTADAVRQAFALPPDRAKALARDVTPLATSGLGQIMSGTARFAVGLVVLVVVLMIFSRCSRDDCDELRATFGDSSNEYQQCIRSGGGGGGGWRSSGGSYGGFSSGGGHK